jgi:hypothetical protein
MTTKRLRYRLHVELLECRYAPSSAPLRLDLVALHEFGHSLGLEHHPDAASIMHDEYNPNYDISTFFSDPAVIVDPNDGYQSLLEIYTPEAIAANETPWKDSADYLPGNGHLELSYSIMPDGTKVKKKVNEIEAVFDATYGPNWRSTLTNQLGAWSLASFGAITFQSAEDAGLRFNYNGLSQADPNSGDIRWGAVPMDGPGGKLAQSYAPPPNGMTAPGDVIFDSLESWEPLPPPEPPPGDGESDDPIPDPPTSNEGDPGTPDASAPNGPVALGGGASSAAGTEEPAPVVSTSESDETPPLVVEAQPIVYLPPIRLRSRR